MSAMRLRLAKLAGPQLEAMLGLSHSITLDEHLKHLIELRASQINGCAYCLDMHWKDARAGGEPEERLYSLDAWRESPLYTERERAALALCEAMTVLVDGEVPDPVWDRAAQHFDDAELAQLVFAIATINTWNRLNIAVRTPPGTYRPARRDADPAPAAR